MSWMTPLVANFICGGIAATSLWSLSYPFDGSHLFFGKVRDFVLFLGPNAHVNETQ